MDATLAVPLLRNSSPELAVQEARQRYAAARPASAALHAQAATLMPGGNTRSVLAYAPFPTAMARGEGCRLWDIDGHAYLDLCGEYTAGLFGHSHPRLCQVLHAAIDRGLNLAAVGAAEVALARLLCDRFPSLQRVRFTNSGTEANLMAITAARAFTGRTHILAFRGGYHGGVLTYPLTGASPVTAPFPVIPAAYNDIEGTVALLHAHAGELAAVIVEPMQGGGGCIPATAAFLAALRAATHAAGIVLIFDEVMTSRSSAGGQQARLGITPDMTTLGKYIAGGMSFGGFGGRADIMQPFADHLPHAGTFNNNVLSMNGGVAALGEIFTPAVAEALFDRGEALRAELNHICRDVAMQFTGLGSLMMPHFRAGSLHRPYVASPAEEALREVFFFDMLDAGLYIARRGMVALSLPVTDTDTRRFTAAVRAFVEQRGQMM